MESSCLRTMNLPMCDFSRIINCCEYKSIFVPKKGNMSADIKEVSYCVGMSLAESLMQQNLGELDATGIAQALDEIFGGKQPRYTPDQANGIIQQFLKEKNEAQFKEYKDAGEQFLRENADRPEVQVTPSGLQYEVLVEGEGPKPSADNTVTVHYHGTLTDGTVFDSSVERGNPATFGLRQVIPGWTEALQLMPKGSRYRLFIPQELAYGANPHPGGAIKPYMTLVFEVELIDIA